MRKNVCVIGVLMLMGLLWPGMSLAQELSIELRAPQKSFARFSGTPQIAEPIEVSGVIAVSIHPYPDQTECLVEYFLDSEPIYSTEGIVLPGAEARDFKCKFDTTKKPNGNYVLYVNYWNKSGNSAIGSQRIVINNRVEE